jgi:hypothetical protein
MCTRRDLPHQAALGYARRSLWLARGLEPHLETSLERGGWHAWTLADPGVPAARLERFDEGGRLCHDELDLVLFGHLSEAMQRHQGSVLVVPDPLARPADSFLARVPTAHVSHGEAVYHLGRSGEPAKLLRVWRQAMSAAGAMALLTTCDMRGPSLDDGDLASAAARAKHILVSAYDGDGVLVLDAAEPRSAG